MTVSLRYYLQAVSFFLVTAICFPAWAALPSPVLQSVFPPGGQAGATFDVTVAGSALDGLSALRSSHPGIVFQKQQQNTFQVVISPKTPPGLYDLQAVCASGLSSTRTFFVTGNNHVVESVPTESTDSAQQVAMDVAISGRIEKKGNVDQYRFTAKRGQTVTIECWVERIDSSLRPVLELFNQQGTRVAVGRTFFGKDPVLRYTTAADGQYTVRLRDLVYSGSNDHFYRLDVGVGPRVVFAVPSVVSPGKTAAVTLYGWNLNGESKSTAGDTAATGYQTRRVQVTAPSVASSARLRLAPAQVAVEGFAYALPGSDVPIQIGLAEETIFENQANNHSPTSAQPVSVPCEVSGQLIEGNETDWYSIKARRGEVFYLEAFGERIGSPTDLDISVFDGSKLDTDGEKELATFHDELANIGGKRFPSAHLDPAGRWVAPADGRYFVAVRNLIGSLTPNPRRVYRLSLHRQQPDVQLVAIARNPKSPAGINVRPGGRQAIDILAFRRRGCNGAIRISAQNLPTGIECPDILLGPGVNHACLVLSANESAESFVGTLDLVGRVDLGGIELVRQVRGGTMVRTDLPNGSGRLTQALSYSVAGQSPLLVTATCARKKFSQGSIVDVAINIDRRDQSHQAEVKLTGVGLPELVRQQKSVIPSGKNKGIVSFYLPPTLPPGRYSIVVQGETSVITTGKSTKGVAVTMLSNAITFEVYPAPYIVEVDLDAPRQVKRGEYIRLAYTARRKNGFIGKIHTTLQSPLQDRGLRARGVTFVGQTESGTLQIVANPDAPLGRPQFLRLEAVGTVEDEPIYLGSCFIELEIVE